MRTKVLLGYIIIAAIIFSCLVPLSLALTRHVPVAYAETATVYERESNNSKDTANEIAVNTNVYGQVSGQRGVENDTDWFKFTTTQSGYFNLVFEDQGSHPIDIYIYDDSGKNRVDGTDAHHTLETTDKKLSTGNYGIPAGTYYIRIVDHYYENYYSTADYFLIVYFTASNEWETENNNIKERADKISLNKALHASLTSRDDEDWFRFTTTQSGYFNFSFEHALSSSSGGWYVYLYDESGASSIEGGNLRWLFEGSGYKYTSNYGIPAGTYYIKIIASNYTINEYWFTVNFTSNNDWETENNSSKEQADEIDVNETIHGALSTESDVDWFKFTTTQSGYFNVTFGHEPITSSSGSEYSWKIYIFDNSGANRVDGTNAYYKATGSYDLQIGNFGVPAGMYYIKIASGDYSLNEYWFTVNFTADEEWETENNNIKERADEIDVSETINASLTSKYDVDWFKLSVSTSCQISLKHNVSLLGGTWAIDVYDKTGVGQVFSWKRQGNSESASSDFIDVSPGVYYIEITYSDSVVSVGEDYSICVIERHEHTGKWVTTVEPTCTGSGVESRTCTICGQVDTRYVDAHGHSFDDVKVIKKATPAQKGETMYTCTYCGEHYIVKDGHLLWVIPVVCVSVIIVAVGAINYVRHMMKKKP